MKIALEQAPVHGRGRGHRLPSPSAAGRARAASPVTLQAAWINDAEFCGYFVAIDNGYYKDEGLDLTYLSGGPDVIPESSIIAGKADLTLTTRHHRSRRSSIRAPSSRSSAPSTRRTRSASCRLAANPISTPEDLVGKTLAVPPVNVISVEAMLKINGIDKRRSTSSLMPMTRRR